MKLITAVVAVAIIFVAGYWGWNQYRAMNEMETALASVRSVAAQMARHSEMRKSDTVTFAEYFKASAESVDEIDKSNVALRTSVFDHRPEARDSAIDFGKSAQEIIRFEVAQARSRMRLNSEKQIEDLATKDLSTSASQYGSKYASDRAQKSRDEQIDILSKMLEDLKTLPAKEEKMIAADRKVKEVFGEGEGFSPDLVESFKPDKPKG
jgi:thymidylate synthase